MKTTEPKPERARPLRLRTGVRGGATRIDIETKKLERLGIVTDNKDPEGRF